MTANDTRAMHAIGNGSFLIYSTGPDLGPIYGPDYTSASFGTLSTQLPGDITVSTRRLPETNCWVHTLRRGTQSVEFTDVMDPGHDVFVRRVRADFACTLRFVPHPAAKSCERADLGCVLHIVPPGVVCSTTDTTRCERRLAVFADGCMSQSPDGREITVAPGEGTLTLAAVKMPNLPQVLAAARDTADIRARDRAYWQAFLAKGKAVRDAISPDAPEYERVQAVLESVPVQIKAQQSRSGGVMAGHYYPMAYVRDQAGVLRGLLRMGYHEEARAILAFWHKKWRRYGNLHNAESMGNEDSRLVFSNDEVEVPAFVVFCACEYLDVTGDTAFMESLFDMLTWAMTVQLGHLAHGMTGFSGDETYIAGNIFPRYFLYHGSADSTLLFIESTRRALAFEEGRGLLSDTDRAGIVAGLAEASDLFRENFVIDGVLYGNNPAREQYQTPPHFHFGFCETHDCHGEWAPLTWLERGEYGMYRCPKCLRVHTEPRVPLGTRILLGSVNLLPVYYHSALFTKEEVAVSAKPYLDAFEETGYMRTELSSERSLGYDFGLLLYNAAFLKSPLTARALRLTLDMVDACGMWAEYYIDGVPDSCRCRPWESAINMEAILYALGVSR